VLFRRSGALEVNGYPEERQTAEDIGFWLKLGQTGKFYNFPKFWHGHRMTGVNIGEIRRREQAKDALYYIKKYRYGYTGFWQAWLKHKLEITAFSVPILVRLIRLIKHSPHQT
jgi:hypothetical protein